MSDVRFAIDLRWAGTGSAVAGQILTDDLELELSGPESMGGRGVDTNPEELLVSAVSSCYTARLSAVLDRAKLPVDSLVVEASGTVTGLPERARVAGIVVTPTILGGDLARQRGYEAAARVAHDRCFIGHTLAPEVSYEVGAIEVREAPVLAMTSDESRPPREHAEATREEAGPGSPDERTAGAVT